MRSFSIVFLATITLFFSYTHNMSKPQTTKKQRIVGLVAARNDATLLEQCLKGLAYYADAIVYLDDASEDTSLEIVESLAKECNVETIISKKAWVRNEPEDRNTLLAAGRAIGGTHFIVLDADEMFTAPCYTDNYLRNQILSLKPGDQIMLHWIQLWKSIDSYRIDNAGYKDFIFCDDGKCFYQSAFIHTKRTPKNLTGTIHTIKTHKTHGVLHFQAVNWRNYLIKQAWYRCMEHIKLPLSCNIINKHYAGTKDEAGCKLYQSPKTWFDYSFFDPSTLTRPEGWRERQVCSWFEQYGVAFFRDLDIWDIDWGNFGALPPIPNFK